MMLAGFTCSIEYGLSAVDLKRMFLKVVSLKIIIVLLGVKAGHKSRDSLFTPARLFLFTGPVGLQGSSAPDAHFSAFSARTPDSYEGPSSYPVGSR